MEFCSAIGTQEFVRTKIPRRSPPHARFRYNQVSSLRELKNQQFVFMGNNLRAMNAKFVLIQYPEGLQAVEKVEDFVNRLGVHDVILELFNCMSLFNPSM